jgi:uncharacterized protein
LVVMSCSVQLYLGQSQSLKDKRQVIKSLKDRIGNAFNVSVAEVADQDLWQKATLGFAVVSNQTRHANEVLSKVVNFIERDYSIELIDYQIEVH